MSKIKSAGPPWVNVGIGSGSKVLNVLNNSGKVVGFQIQIYEPITHEFCPNKGLIMPSKNMEVEIKELQKGSNEIRFHLMALHWPSTVTQFNSSTWKALEDKREGLQLVAAGQVPKFTGITEVAMPVKSNRSKRNKSSKKMSSETADKLSSISKTSGTSADKLSAEADMPKLLQVQPPYVSFKPPNSKAQIITGTFKNVRLHAVAFKIQTNRQQIYSVRPKRGIIAASQELKVEYEMNDTMTETAERDKHAICVMALIWNSTSKEFDAEEWKKLEENKNELQKVTLSIDFQGKGTPLTSTNEDKAPPKIPSKTPPKPNPVESVAYYLQAPKPHILFFKSPFQGEHNCLEMKNISSELVAYKVQTNKREFYTISPSRGLVKPGATEQVKYIMHDKFDLNQLLTDRDKHQFQILVLKWSKNSSSFDVAEYDKLLASKKDIQKITINVEFEQIPLKNVAPPIKTSPKIAKEVQVPAPPCPVIGAHPLIFNYTIPSGDEEQSQSTTVINMSPKVIAYKFKADKGLMSCFSVKNIQGVIKPGKGEQIILTLKKEIEKAPGNKSKHTSTIKAINWPTEKFSEDTWKELETKKPAEFQNVKLEVKFEVKEEKEEKEDKAPPDESSEEDSEKEDTKESSVAPPVPVPVPVPVVEPFSTRGPNLVSITPTKVTYKGPYGTKKQSSVVKLTNATEKAVAFKVQINQRKFYLCNPSRGVLPPSASADIDIELNETFTDNDATNEIHRFYINAMPWSDDDAQFDPDKWKELEKENKEKETMQKIIFGAQF